ncbi:MAG: hypothetical protein JOS17DRAFT_43478 [Linnemannia elongata]|nr:MAG: hypothetical protein JOS17DRAFT_43478 [Linnemannia elongata]
MVHAYFNPSQAAAVNALATKKDSTFEVTYFNFHGLGGVTRTLLAISGNKFTSVVPEDWTAEKPHTPFGVMPLLAEISADGKTTIRIAETGAIERYLARKFGLLGSDAFEEILVNTFVSNNHSLQWAIISKYFMVKDPEVKAANKESLITEKIAPWIKYHEEHLSTNGGNGHYVGNKISYADVTTDFVIGMIQGMTGEELVSKTKTPAIWAVREKLNKIESVAAWKQTEEFKAMDEKNFATLGFR